jgi:hypothetical protein
MIQDAKSTPRDSFFNSSIVDKIAKADMKYAADGITTTYDNLGVSGCTSCLAYHHQNIIFLSLPAI